MEEDTTTESTSTGVPKVENSPYLIPLAIMAAGALVAGAVVYSNKGGSTSSVVSSVTQPGQPVENPKSTTKSNLVDDDPSLGNPDAPVVIVEFGDFQCPFCKRFYDTSRKDIIEKYVRTGKARLVYRDFPLEQIHPYARSTAEAAECAGDQDKYWAYHDALYEKQDEFSTLNFVALAGELGLNKEEFQKCFEERKHKDEVTRDFNDGIAAGVAGTPASFINGKLIPGAQPFSVFESAIEEALKITK